MNICGHLITYVWPPNAAKRDVSRVFPSKRCGYMFRHLVVLVDIGALCEVDRDGILGAILQRDARGDPNCFCCARRAEFFVRRHARLAAENSCSDQLFDRAET